jgi:PAS domain S-box-containing protein
MQQKSQRVLARLAQLILEHKDEIVEHWVKAMEEETEIESADSLTHRQVVDHVPAIFDELAALLRAHPGDHSLKDASIHGRYRWLQGYRLDELLHEFGLLREVFLEHLSIFLQQLPDLTPEIELEARKLIHRFLDKVAIASARQFAEEQVEEAERHRGLTATLANSVAEGLSMVDTEGRLTFMNPAAEELLGWKKEDLFGKNLHELVHYKKPDGSPFPFSECPLGIVLASGKTIRNLEGQLIRKDGSFVDVLFFCSPIIESGKVTGGVVAWHNITERKRAEEEREKLLKDVENRAAVLDAVILSIPDAVYIGNQSGILKCNGAALEMLGFDDLSELNQNIQAISEKIQTRFADTGEKIPPGEEAFDYALRGIPMVREVIVRNLKTGQDRVLRSAAAPIEIEGNIIGAVAINTDITENKLLQLELRKKAEEAERANRTKDEFIALVSHELRTPLTAMLGWTRMLGTGKLDEATTERALDSIVRNVKTQERLISDLLDVGRIITGKLHIDLQQVELVSVIEGALEIIRPMAEAKKITLESVLDPMAINISGDPNRLQQVVLNLLSNAIKFTDENGKVIVQLMRLNSKIMLKVIDTGRGIKPDFLPFVFDRFRQAEIGTAREHSGLGLGLAIVRHLVELHGGLVRAESDGEGKGATFIVEFPLLS